MNKIVVYVFWALFLVGLVLRVLFAFFSPDRFADGARRVLFLDERKKKLFRSAEKNRTEGKSSRVDEIKKDA